MRAIHLLAVLLRDCEDPLVAFDRLRCRAAESVCRPERVQGGNFERAVSLSAELCERGLQVRAGTDEVTAQEAEHSVGEGDERTYQGVAGLRCQLAPLLDECRPGVHVTLDVRHHAGSVEALGPFESGWAALPGHQLVVPAPTLVVLALRAPEQKQGGGGAQSG